MKRYGEKTIVKGMRIRYSHTEKIYNESPKILDCKYGNPIGYITIDLWYKLIKSGKLVKDFGDYWYAEHIII